MLLTRSTPECSSLEEPCVVEVVGVLDAETAASFDEQLSSIVSDQEVVGLELDLRSVSLLSAAGITSLLVAKRNAGLVGGTCAIGRSSAPARRMIRLAGLAHWLSDTDRAA